MYSYSTYIIQNYIKNINPKLGEKLEREGQGKKKKKSRKEKGEGENEKRKTKLFQHQVPQLIACHKVQWN